MGQFAGAEQEVRVNVSYYGRVEVEIAENVIWFATSGMYLHARECQ